ncbi:unnamed protein product, partial [Oikopleura dioica]
ATCLPIDRSFPYQSFADELVAHFLIRILYT